MSILQDIYDSEINFRISTLWDGGFDIELGDEMNGFVASTSVNRWGEVEPWLMKAVIEHQPDSLFARMYRDGKSAWLATKEYREAAVAQAAQEWTDADR